MCLLKDSDSRVKVAKIFDNHIFIINIVAKGKLFKLYKHSFCLQGEFMITGLSELSNHEYI